ncbi:MAG: hypothetical protein KGM24_08095 [Elusimicrobia bacterium]|nr:hypothetical protein [Elusimicrobiota bacterium]
MRRLAVVLVLGACACAAPAPCTQDLCPSRVAGSYRVAGWQGAVVVTPGAPAVPIVSDSSVEVLDGSVEFALGGARLDAPAGTAFRYELRPPPKRPTPAVEVSAGALTVRLSSAAAPVTVSAGSSYVLPLPK